MEDKLKQSEQAREQLAKELVRTKVSLECADNTIKKQQENIKELEAENEKLKAYLQEIKAIAEMDICSNCFTQKRGYNCQCLADTILHLITKTEEE